MIIVMDKNATKEMVDHVIQIVKDHDLIPEPSYGTTRIVIGVLGDRSKLREGNIARLPGVKEILLVSKPYKRVSREFQSESTLVKINDDVIFGDNKPVIIAGPCGVESKEQIRTIAKGVKELGADMLRGGAFKPRTSPYSFQGMGADGLKLLKEVGDEFGLPIVSECVSTEDLGVFEKYADMIQIGARNMQNFDLITKVARLGKPVLLKRGMSATVDEFMFAAEYILNEGNKNLVLCERGIRTFEQSTRNILDLNSMALIKQVSHLPIIVDPSHAAGRYDLVTPLARAGLAAGADGIIVEVHNKPDEALSDGKQSLTLESFAEFMKDAPKYHHYHG
ncbi:3-deoxy-7-phosphoheptulonate synthase [Patescibacteria group bacterium]|nr:3-deoxy-7-phosphoheptulonate synthase [Patescibacteria group bacterium]